jgi:hypothetical protein
MSENYNQTFDTINKSIDENERQIKELYKYYYNLEDERKLRRYQNDKYKNRKGVAIVATLGALAGLAGGKFIPKEYKDVLVPVVLGSTGALVLNSYAHEPLSGSFSFGKRRGSKRRGSKRHKIRHMKKRRST